MESNKILENLIRLLPYWHYKVERPIKQKQKHQQISYEAYFCLLTLQKCGARKMSELANDLRLSKQQGTQLIEKLYQYQLIERLQDETDRRAVVIKISTKGSDYLEDNPFDVSSLKHQIEQHLTKEEQEELDQTLASLLRLLAKIE